MPDAPVVETPVTSISASDWRSSLPDDIKADPSLKDIKDVGALAKGYISTKALVGAKGLIVPGKDAKPDEVAAFHNALGRPEKPDGYNLPTDNMPDGWVADPKRVAAYAAELHALGVSDQQFAGLVRFEAKEAAERHTASVAAKKAVIDGNIATLKKDFGQAFEESNRIITNAVRVYGGDVAVDHLLTKHPELATDPVFAKMMLKIGKEIANDEIKGGGHHSGFSLTPDAARAKIDANMSKSEFTTAYYDKANPGHAAAVAEHNKLYAIAHPEPVTT